MEAKNPSNSEILNVRNLAISRRGGVRTRGGRLPPINMRELTTSNKKIVAPKIPQRRKVIKTEAETSDQSVIKTEKQQAAFQNARGRGRQQKVFLQTEGSFLAEGPAARLKRDPAYSESSSVSRSSRKSGKGSSDRNIDVDAVKDLMESFVAGEEYENDNEGKPPLRLPFQKNVTCKLKQETDIDDKTIIKKEVIEDFETGIKKEIKIEKDEDFASAKENIKKENESEKPSADSFLNVKEQGTLILLQLPLLSDSLKVDYPQNKEDPKEDKAKSKQPAKEIEPKTCKFIDNFEEGFLGKLKIMKSGRMRLTLGSLEFELLDGTPSETYQEAVAIKVEGDEGDITVLGKVEKKLILSPVINKLLIENVKDSTNLIFEE